MNNTQQTPSGPEFTIKNNSTDTVLHPEPVITTGQVEGNHLLSLDTWLLTINCPEIAGKARPDSFVKLRAWEEDDEPLLDRPLSIHSVFEGKLLFLYRVVGRGTAKLSKLKHGDTVKISGPLGRSLDQVMNPGPLYLVAGGMGLAPMALVRDWLGSEKSHLFYGERHGKLQVEETWLSSWAGNYTATAQEAPVYGQTGLVTQPLAAALEQKSGPIFACGPVPMLRAVCNLALKYGVPLWVSVEADMACGFGVCLTCSLPLKDGGRFRVCQEGPVMDAQAIDWEKMT